MIGKIWFTLIFSLFIIGSFGQDLPKVFMECEMGTIVCEIDTVNAPVSANNFLKHIELGTFKDAVFYRVVRMDNQPNNEVKIEVIQGGLFVDEKIDKIESIRHETTKETGIKHKDGTISMARNKPGSASTEFFICIEDQPELDFGGKRNPDGQGFAAFGKVTKGMDVVRNIQQQKDEGQYLVEKIQITEIQIR
jgi:peptidyl-prolyl cis-trans isomerase A (cyclophilin A)